MYSVGGYGEMIADAPRMLAYEAALRRAVGPESVVLDLGTGSGIMAFLACRLGARKVIAVEPDRILQLARQLAAANGMETQITFLHGLSTALEPPHRCDVVVSDIRGVLPLFGHHIAAIVDVRERWLVEGGIQIPREDSISAAVIESQKVWDRHFMGWTADVGVDFSPAFTIRSGSLSKAVVAPEALLTEPAEWVSIDYRTVTSPNHEARLSWRVDRDGTGHGMALWFESVLAEGVRLSNRPGAPPMIYGQMYFPWPRPISLRRGDRVEVLMRAHLMGEDYVWAWDTDVHPARQPGSVGATFRQSTLQGSVGTREGPNRGRLDERATLVPKGHASLVALRAMEQGLTVREIAATLMRQFPEEFPQLRHSLGFVSDLQDSYELSGPPRLIRAQVETRGTAAPLQSSRPVSGVGPDLAPRGKILGSAIR